MTLPRPRLPMIVLIGIVLALGAPARAQEDAPLLEGDAEFITNATWAPDGRLFYTEKDTGHVWIAHDGVRNAEPFITLDVVSSYEQGLLGIALDPNFEVQPWVYLFYSDPETRLNRIIRVKADGDRSGEVESVIDLLSVDSGYHNGGDLAFGPDGRLYASVGEAHDPEDAQDPTSVGGKVLRLNPDGSTPADNPFGSNAPAFSMGHRNSFGLCFDQVDGQLWETENGPGSWDEVNAIEAGGNYGWPIESGPGKGSRFINPVLAFEQVIVPTGCVARDGTLWFGDFQGSLHRYEAGQGSDEVIATFPEGITDLEFAPDGSLAVVMPSGIERYDLGDSAQQATPTTTAPQPASTPNTTESVVSLAIFLALILGGVAAVGVVAWRRRDDVRRDEG